MSSDLARHYESLFHAIVSLKDELEEQEEVIDNFIDDLIEAERGGQDITEIIQKLDSVIYNVHESVKQFYRGI